MASYNDTQKKILKFYDSVAQSKNFRQQVLFSLAELFNLECSTFFLVDSEGNLVDPVTLNIDTNSETAYLKYYEKKDIFHPCNLPGKEYLKNPIMYITDIMPIKKYEKTEFYNDFLKKQGFYHEIAIALIEKERMIGGIGLLKSKKEQFSNDTKENLKVVYNFISGLLSQNLDLQQAVTNQHIYQHCTNESPIGIILLDEKLSIIFSNNAAHELILQLFEKNIGLEQFVRHTTSLLGKSFHKGVSSLSLYAPSLKEFTICISPLETHSVFNEKTFLMKLIPENITFNKSVDVDFQRKFELTNRELEVLNLLLQGLTNEEMSQQLFISLSTVKAHLRSIYNKTGTSNKLKLYQKIHMLKSNSSTTINPKLFS